MKNPITYLENEKKYMVWTSFYGVKLMKFFPTPEDAVGYIKSNPNRCMDIKEPVDDEISKIWVAELNNDLNLKRQKHNILNEVVENEEKPSRLWLYVVVFVIAFIFNFLISPEKSLQTLISAAIQGSILIIVVLVFVTIKNLFKGK